MTRVPRASLRTVLAFAALAILPACGSDSSPTPPSTTPPTTLPPPTQVVVSSGSGPLATLTAAGIGFTTSTSGRLDATADWTFASNDVDIYLVRGACTFEQFVALQCNIVSFSESTTLKPERLTFSGAPADNYIFVIINFGPADESVAYQVVLTSGPGVFAVPGAAGASGAAVSARALRRLRELKMGAWRE